MAVERTCPIYKIGLASGGGVGFNFEATDFITVSAGYFGGDSFNPVGVEDGGFINEEYSALGQVTLSLLDDKLQLAGTYSLGKFGNFIETDDDGLPLPDGGTNGIFDAGVGTARAGVPLGDGNKVTTNSYGVEAAFQLNDRIALNAFGMYTDAQQSVAAGEAEIWSYGAGLSFPDLGKEGNLAAVFVGAEPYLGSSNVDLDGDGETDSDDVPIHIEGLYKYQFNDNISITPGVVYLITPNGVEDDEDALIGVLRTTFTF